MTAFRQTWLALLLGTLVLLGASCNSASRTQNPDGPASVVGPDGATDVGADVHRMPDVATGTCMPGATAEDCALCTYGRNSCTRACPKVDCNVWPTPAACADLCGTTSCCTCRREIGNEHWWRPTMVTCMTEQQGVCADLRRRWRAIIDRPGMRACATSGDCAVASGPTSCNSSVVIDGVAGTGVNAGAYAATDGRELEGEYARRCGPYGIADAAPPTVQCIDRLCVTQPRSCLTPPPDGGR